MMFSFKRRQYNLKSDEELIDLFKSEQSSLCLEILYKRYGHLVLGSCMKYLKNVEEAEDLTMSLFEKLPGKILQHDISNFKSWLYTVTRNECFMLLRKEDKNRKSTELPEMILDESNDQDIHLSEVRLSILEQVLKELKEDQRICLELFYLKERSYQQISDDLKMSLMQVKSAIQNGKRNLKIRLEQRHEFKH